MQKLKRLKCRIVGHEYCFDKEAFTAEIQKSYAGGIDQICRRIWLLCECCGQQLQIDYQSLEAQESDDE
jgi:hypothetical protein